MTDFTFRHLRTHMDDLEAAMIQLRSDRDMALNRERIAWNKNYELEEGLKRVKIEAKECDKFSHETQTLLDTARRELAEVIENGRKADLRQAQEREGWKEKIEQLKAESASYFKQIERLVAEKNELKRELACHRIGACVRDNPTMIYTGTPWAEINGRRECLYCGVHEGEEHKPDCSTKGEVSNHAN